MVSVQPFNPSSICLVMKPGVLEMVIDFYAFYKGLQENTQNVCGYRAIEKNEQKIKDRRSWKSVP